MIWGTVLNKYQIVMGPYVFFGATPLKFVVDHPPPIYKDAHSSLCRRPWLGKIISDNGHHIDIPISSHFNKCSAIYLDVISRKKSTTMRVAKKKEN